MAKRTYSRCGKGTRSTSYDPTWADDEDHCKRAKVEEAGCILPKAQPEKRSSLLKKGLRFGGPTSIPDEEMHISEKPVLSPKASLFDRVLHSGRHQYGRPSQVNANRLRADNSRLVSAEDKPDQLRNSQLPTPPAEAQKAQARDEQTSSNEHEPCRRDTDVLTSSQLCVSRAYKAVPTAPPRRTIMGDRLSRRSKEATTWHSNQTNSSLLQLPAGVRNKIFGYVLGGCTIKIGYETYRNTFENDEPVASVPIFKYNCCVYNGRSNPFKAHPPRLIARSYTTLNDVCRQLYEETAMLPYQLNPLAFSSSSVMFNFLYQEQRLTRQQRNAITQLIIPDGVIEQNALNGMRGLNAFFLPQSVKGDAKGRYAVVREEGGDAKLVYRGSFR